MKLLRISGVLLTEPWLCKPPATLYTGCDARFGPDATARDGPQTDEPTMTLTLPAFPPALALAPLLASLMLLGACNDAQQDPVAEQPLPVPHMTPTVSQDGALEEREPDTCHAADYTAALGRPSSVIPTLGITRPINVVEWRGIEPQIYNPQRIVFRLDAAGNIFNIDCG